MPSATAFGLALVGLAIAFPCSAGAMHSPGQGGPDDFIVGSARVQNAVLGEAQLNVAAHSGPAGETPRGRVRLRVSGLIGSIDAAGEVQCLSTSRGTGDGFAELDEPLPDGSRYLLFDVLDPVDPADPGRPDEFFWAFSATRPERQFGLCMSTGRGIVGPTTGNLVVHDAPPLGPQF